MADTVTEQDFEQQVLQSDQLVLVDFWAEWCGPCHAIAPVLDEIAQERSELKVVKLNIDEQPAVAQRYGVMSIPTLILFKDGEPHAAAVGAMPKSMLEQRLGLAEAAA
ncbi:MAG TPA: thioredoxin [Gaiellaceae bacterium]|jgi:thioredoxin 1|nr:thioredoxin [Gaiellaceae bacterium]